MSKLIKRAKEDEAEVRRREDIEAAWQLHTTPEHRIRRAWLERHMVTQNGRCAYCNVSIRTDLRAGWHDNRATIDHVVARARGGTDTEDNTVAACAACNVAKADTSKEAFLAHPVRRQRLQQANTPPDRLSADPASEFYDGDALARGVGVRFRLRERDDVQEYCISGAWVRVPVGKTVDRRGRPVTVKLRGAIEAYFLDLGDPNLR